MIKISDLSFARGNQLILKNINIEIRPSEILLVKGANGKGKTTLLSCIANLLEPLSGSITYFSEKIDSAITSKNFTFWGEENYGIEDFSIIKNIHYWLNANNASPKEENIKKTISNIYGSIDIKKKFSTLSYGQKRKIKILLLMLIDKPVWILDDPYNGLDNETIHRLNEIILLKRRGNGMIIIASHQHPKIEGVKEFQIL